MLQVGIKILASALVLASCPPRMHCVTVHSATRSKLICDGVRHLLRVQRALPEHRAKPPLKLLRWIQLSRLRSYFLYSTGSPTDTKTFSCPTLLLKTGTALAYRAIKLHLPPYGQISHVHHAQWTIPIKSYVVAIRFTAVVSICLARSLQPQDTHIRSQYGHPQVKGDECRRGYPSS